MKAIIPAAGLGTRFLPATKAVPKELLPVLDKPTIQYVVEEALAAGADEVVIVSNREKQAIVEHFSPNDALVAHLQAAGKPVYAEAVRHAGALPVSFVEQLEPKGLGHAVYCAAPVVLGLDAGASSATASASSPALTTIAAPVVPVASVSVTAPESFYVLLGDVIVPGNNMLPRMLAISREHGNASVIAVLRVPIEEVSRFGVIAGEALSEEVWRVSALVEKPPIEEAPSDLVVFGRYLLSPRIMELLAHTEPGAGGEIQLTDALVELLATEELYALIIDPTSGFDVGTIENWLATNNRLSRTAP